MNGCGITFFVGNECDKSLRAPVDHRPGNDSCKLRTGSAPQVRFHLLQFDTIALELHLIIGSAHVVKNAVFIPRAEIAGQIPALAVNRAKPVGCQLRLVEIAVRKLRAA